MGIVVGRAYGVNLKKKGSGNAGLTNALRVLGPKAAAIVFAGDVLKGVLACFLGYLVTRGELGPERFIDLENPGMGMLIAGTFCIIGHIYPAYFKFRGGKGVLTAVTVVSLMDYRVAAIMLGLFIVVLLMSRYVSLGSIVAAVFLPVVSVALSKPAYFLVYSVTIAALIIALFIGFLAAVIIITTVLRKVLRKHAG
jgi:glycerol-3-phosphate acyltransferase PlsY